MKEYTIHNARKARTDIGNCRVCGVQIKKGDVYKHTHVGKEIVAFCTNCEPNQSLIGKNRVGGETTIKTEATPIEQPQTVEQNNQEQVINEPISEATESTDKVFCKRCNNYHVVGSRRYQQHKNDLVIS